MGEFRTSVKCTLIAYTHRGARIDLSSALVGFGTRKQCKQIGAATFTLKALQNWQNVLAPNDMVAFYEDTGEGYGPEWVFWGFIDDEPNPTSVSQEAYGAPVLGTYVLNCSDFQKGLDARLYQNMQLAGRRDTTLSADLTSTGTLGTDVDLGVVRGTPADFLDAVLTTTLGFGSQGVLPSAIPKSQEEQQTRSDMRRRAVLRIPAGVRALYPFLQDPLVTAPDFEQLVIDATNKALARAKSGAALAGEADALLLLKTVVQRTLSTTPRTIVDMMNFDFVERECIDGYAMLQPILPTQTTVDITLNQLVYENTNEIVNELVFDLRPVAGVSIDSELLTPNARIGAPSYDSGEDILGTKVEVKYVPAVMLREYPFSTATGVDLSGLTIGSDATGAKEEFRLIANARLNTAPLRQRLDAGAFMFGPIFDKEIAHSPDRDGRIEAGRVYYDYRTSLGANGAFLPFAKSEDGVPPIKHLDVVGIDDEEILSDTLRRTGANIVNLVSVIDGSSNSLFTHMLTQDILPIATPVSIQRDRLKPTTLRTKFLEAIPPDASAELANSSSGSIAKRAVRWGLMWDHWHQHDYEYISGSVTLKRPRPDIRVAYRADFPKKHEAYYVEAVGQSGQLVDGRWSCLTVLELSRGQRVDPSPTYVPPQLGRRAVEQYTGMNDLIRTGGGDRGPRGRLGLYFNRIDSDAVVSPSSSQQSNLVDMVTYSGPIVSYPEYRPLGAILDESYLNRVSNESLGGVSP